MSKHSYTTTEIARLFDVYTTTVADWIDSGRLAAYRTAGGHRRVRPSELRRFLDEQHLPLPPDLMGAAPEPGTVLAIDDDRAILVWLADRLEPLGFKVESASDGFEGVYKIGRIRPDAVVLDIMMPGMDGYQVCERIRETPEIAGTLVIAVTALDDPQVGPRVLAAGADHFLTKPIDFESLKELLRRGVEARASRKRPGAPPRKRKTPT